MIVDDEPLNLELLERELAAHDYTVESARNGGEALRKVDAFVPDLILLDVLMPEMDGFETTKLIKQEFPMIPVIAQSANVLEEDITKAFNAGCDNYITKPIKREALLRMISMVLK